MNRQHAFRLLLFLSVSVAVTFPVPSLAQSDAWDLLRRDEHLLARERFEERLAADSLDVEALKGMIILSDLHGDVHAFETCLRRLITTTWDEPTFRVFRWDVEVSDTITAESPMSEASRVGARLSLANTLDRFKKHEEAEKLCRSLIPANRWSMIGPFENIGGSGFVTTYPVEREKFNRKASYPLETGVALRWVTPTHVNPTGRVEFDGHLPNDDGVCFANTFVTIPSDRTLQLRIGRSAPIAVWLDDDLVYSDRERIGFGNDNEIVQLEVKGGTHRVLVKLSPYYDEIESYDLLETVGWRDAGYGEGGNFNQGIFALRFTDTAGRAYDDVELNYEGSYKPADYTPTVTRRGALDHFLKRVEADPNDLFAAYALCKAYMTAGSTREGEEFFQRLVRQNDNVVIRWLLARLYAANGKIERTYTVLENADGEKTPVYGLIYEKFSEIDPLVEEERYLGSLGLLREIAPSNFSVIHGYLSYYDKKDLKKENDAFIDEVIGLYPEYEDRLESYRSDHKYRSDVDERSPREIIDSLMTSLETEFDHYAYEKVIDYFTDKEEVETVLRLHDERIEAYPYFAYYYRAKADYLFEEKRYDEALEVLEEAIGVDSYGMWIYEKMGDIHALEGDKKRARESYLKALDIDIDGSAHYGADYSENSVIEKLDNLGDGTNVTGLFTTKISPEAELNSTAWQERYGEEESVIQYYTKHQIIDTLGRIRTYQKMMIRILTESGADWWTEYNFGFLGSLNFVRVRKESGAEVVPDRIGETVVFKNLEPGDVIQLEGQSEETMFDGLFEGEYFDMSYFSHGAPVHFAQLEILVPKGEYLGYLHINLDDNVVKRASGGFDSYSWTYGGLDRTPDEEAMLDSYDGLRTILVGTMPDWTRVVDWYERTTYRRSEASYEVRAIVDSLIVEGMSDARKVETIYNFITRQINYSYVPFLQSAYTPKLADLTLSANIGDCKDVATLMIAMLREVGVESWYTLVKTNSFNHQKFVPSQYFDHVIVGVNVDGQTRYMDLTTNFYPHYVIPMNDCGAWSLNIRKGEKEIFELPNDHLDPAKNTVEIEIDAAIDTARSVALEVTAKHAGLEGGTIREALSYLSKEEMKNFILELMGKGTFQDLRLRDYAYENRFDISQPLASRYTFTANRFSDRVSNLYIFRIPWMVGIRNSQAIQTADRATRLDVTELCRTAPTRQRTKITFPAGYNLTEVPQDINVESEFGTYRVTFRGVEGGLIAEKYQQFTTSRIDPERYADFREFYLRILDLDEARYAIIAKK